MPPTHNTEWTIERGEEAFDICIDFEYKSGSPAHYGSLTYPGHPEEPGEVEITSVWRKSDEHLTDAPEFKLTDDEQEKIELYILENPPEPDYDYDDYL